jgi:hypothetical protein
MSKALQKKRKFSSCMEIWQILFCLLKTNLSSQFKQLSSLKFDATQNASKMDQLGK